MSEESQVMTRPEAFEALNAMLDVLTSIIYVTYDSCGENISQEEARAIAKAAFHHGDVDALVSTGKATVAQLNSLVYRHVLRALAERFPVPA